MSDHILSNSSRYDQLKSRQSNTTNTKQFGEIIGRFKGKSGEKLEAVFATPRASESEHRLNLTALRLIPNLTEPFAKAIVVVGRKMVTKTRLMLMINLEVGFIEYLSKKSLLDLTIEQITTERLIDFLAWIDEKRPDGTTWKKGTQKNKYRSLTRLIRAMSTNQVSGVSVSPLLRIPVLADPKKHYTNHPALPEEEWKKIYRAAIKEIQKGEQERSFLKSIEIEAREMFKAEKNSRFASQISGDSYKNEMFCFGCLLEMFESRVLFTKKEIESKDPFLAKALYSGGDPNICLGEKIRAKLFRYFYPDAAALVPYIILFALMFGWNAEVVMNIELDNFTFSDILGVKRVSIKPYKKRSRRKQIRSFPVSDDIDNPARLFNVLSEFTNRLREIARPSVKNRLFIVPFQKQQQGTVRVFKPLPAIDAFAKRNNLKRFLLSSMRPTALEIASLLTGGDVRVLLTVAGHRQAGLIETTYKSVNAGRREESRLSEIQVARARFFSSKGRIDPRIESENKADLAAATPGWDCFDPFSSPIVGQIEGRLCSAFGMCPICPHSSLNLNSPYSIARAMQLRDQIQLSQNKIFAPRWLEVWAPIMQQINNFWLVKVKDEMLESAKRLKIAALPDLE